MEHVSRGDVRESISEDRSVDKSNEEAMRDNDIFLFKNNAYIREIGAKMEVMEISLADTNKIVDFEVRARIGFDKVESKPRPSFEEILKSANELLDEVERKELQKREENAGEEKKKITSKERRLRKKMRRNILIALFGVIAGGVALYFLVEWLESDKKTSDHFTAKDADDAEKLIGEWKKLDETKFWERIGQYVEKNNPSFEFQMQMMGYIKLFANDKNAPKFTWTPTQKLDAIDQLVKAFTGSPEKKGKKSLAIYTALVAIKPDNRQLPRGLAAGITETALAHIIALTNADKEDD
jgi:hypothetical protein